PALRCRLEPARDGEGFLPVLDVAPVDAGVLVAPLTGDGPSGIRHGLFKQMKQTLASPALVSRREAARPLQHWDHRLEFWRQARFGVANRLAVGRLQEVA